MNSDTRTADEIQDMVWNIVTHIIHAKNAIDYWKVIIGNAELLNQHDSFFWKKAQVMAMDSAILHTCILFDEDKKSSLVPILLRKKIPDILDDDEQDMLKQIKFHRDKVIAHKERWVNADSLASRKEKIHREYFDALTKKAKQLTASYVIAYDDNKVKLPGNHEKNLAESAIEIISRLYNVDKTTLRKTRL